MAGLVSSIAKRIVIMSSNEMFRVSCAGVFPTRGVFSFLRKATERGNPFSQPQLGTKAKNRGVPARNHSGPPHHHTTCHSAPHPKGANSAVSSGSEQVRGRPHTFCVVIAPRLLIAANRPRRRLHCQSTSPEPFRVTTSPHHMSLSIPTGHVAYFCPMPHK
jgi:hypothetical protein